MAWGWLCTSPALLWGGPDLCGHPEAAVSGTGPDVDGLALLGGHTPRATEALNHQETVCRTMAIRRGLRAGQ